MGPLGPSVLQYSKYLKGLFCVLGPPLQLCLCLAGVTFLLLSLVRALVFSASTTLLLLAPLPWPTAPDLNLLGTGPCLVLLSFGLLDRILLLRGCGPLALGSPLQDSSLAPLSCLYPSQHCGLAFLASGRLFPLLDFCFGPQPQADCPEHLPRQGSSCHMPRKHH